MSRVRQFTVYWIPVLLYACFILTVSSQPHVPGGGRLPDKPLHAIEYSGFAFLLARAMTSGNGRSAVWPMAAAALAAGLFAAFDEYYQSYIPGRDSSVLDWLADITGIGVTISLLLLRRSKEHSPA